MNVPFIKTEKARFVIVGGINTAIDFGVLFALTFFGIDKIIANYISTTCGLIFSFFANKSFTFQTTTTSKKQFVLFIIITLTGLWVLQPLVIEGSMMILSRVIQNTAICLFVAKLVATAVSLTWNYLFYSRIVFKKTSGPQS